MAKVQSIDSKELSYPDAEKLVVSAIRKHLEDAGWQNVIRTATGPGSYSGENKKTVFTVKLYPQEDHTTISTEVIGTVAFTSESRYTGLSESRYRGDPTSVIYHDIINNESKKAATEVPKILKAFLGEALPIYPPKIEDDGMVSLHFTLDAKALDKKFYAEAASLAGKAR